MNFLVAIVYILLGLAACFYGYPIFRILLPFAGLIFGFLIGAGIFPDQWLLALALGIIFAIVFFILARFLWNVAVLVFGLAMGWSVGQALGESLFGSTGFLTWLLALIGAIVIGIIIYKLRDIGIMLAMALGGAVAIVFGASELLPFFDLNNGQNLLATLAILILGVVGFLVQYRMFKGRNLYAQVM